VFYVHINIFKKLNIFYT